MESKSTCSVMLALQKGIIAIPRLTANRAQGQAFGNMRSPYHSAKWHLMWRPFAFPCHCMQVVHTLGVQLAP